MNTDTASELIHTHLDLLGHPVKDKVTGFTGVVVSMTFDLYGCIQAIVNPPMDRVTGKIGDSAYFDVGRLTVQPGGPVMTRPDFVQGAQARGEKGPAEKPGAFKA